MAIDPTHEEITEHAREFTDPDGWFRPITPDKLAELEALIGHDPDMLTGPARGVKWRGPIVALTNMQALSTCVLRAAMTASLDDAREMRRVVHESWFALSLAKWGTTPDARNAWHAAHRTAMRDLARALPENRRAFDAGRKQRAGKRAQGRAEALGLRDRVRELMREHGWPVTRACAEIDGEASTGTTYARLRRRGLLQDLDTSKAS